MDFGLFHKTTHRPGSLSYNEPLNSDQAEVYQDGKRYIYNVDIDDRERFKDWVICIFADNELDRVSHTDDLTTYYVDY